MSLVDVVLKVCEWNLKIFYDPFYQDIDLSHVIHID